MRKGIIHKVRSSKFSKLLSAILISLLLLQTNGCFFYKAVISGEPPQSIIEKEHLGSYIMMHYGDEVKALDNINIYDDHITARTSEVVGHDYYKKIAPGQTRRYRVNKANDQSEVLNEVHIYVTQYTQIENDQISIRNQDMGNAVLYDPAVGSTILSTGALSFVGGLTILTVLLIMSSCPFVYSFDGNQYIFSGEIYSGAIYPAVERHDYLPLESIMPFNGKYRLRIANEIREIQNTNLVELLYADHPSNIDIMVDKYGILHSVREPVLPYSAINLKGDDILKFISEKDAENYTGEELLKDPDLVDGVVMEYNIPPDIDKVKLLIRAKNSFWLEYVFKKFHDLLGRRYEKFAEKKSKQPGDDLLAEMLNQHLPVSVYVEKDGIWEFRDYFNIAGPMALKEDILSVDVSNVPHNPLRIKLEYGTCFWELDYSAIDYSDDLDIRLSKISIESATDEKGEDISAMIISDDNLYYIQPEIGNAADLLFSVPGLKDEVRSLFLHSKGHYKILRDPATGKAEMSTLKRMKEGDGLVKYSRELRAARKKAVAARQTP